MAVTIRYDYTVTCKGKTVDGGVNVRREAILRAFTDLQPGQQLIITRK